MENLFLFLYFIKMDKFESNNTTNTTLEENSKEQDEAISFNSWLSETVIKAAAEITKAIKNTFHTDKIM